MSSGADLRVAKRYAVALFHVARSTGKVETIQADLTTLSDLWSQVPKVREAMESPLIPADRKKAIIRQAFGPHLDGLTIRFLDLLVDKRREPIVPVVREEFIRRADLDRGLVRAAATVAAPLDDLQRAAMVEALERRTGKRVELKLEVDPAIIGGAVIRMEDTVIDGSVRGALERIREQMLQER